MPHSKPANKATDIVRQLRQRIGSGKLPAGAKLPTEAALCEEFGVSRPTVRSAVKELEVLGLVTTRHGVGTFVREATRVRTGIERMSSITESIRESGKEPGMIYGRRSIRLLLPAEAEHMNVGPDTEVLDLRRKITADGVVVAYSYDLIPTSILPPGFDPADFTGSVFAYFDRHLGRRPSLGYAEVHAVNSDKIGWGPEAKEHRLYILLDQLEYDSDHVLMMYTRSYFIEGVYAFQLVRTN
jgi:GntR family transcriptional regulator